MFSAIVGERSNDPTLIGDGPQTIYPGGHGMSEACLTLTWRSVVR